MFLNRHDILLTLPLKEFKSQVRFHLESEHGYPHITGPKVLGSTENPNFRMYILSVNLWTKPRRQRFFAEQDPNCSCDPVPESIQHTVNCCTRAISLEPHRRELWKLVSAVLCSDDSIPKVLGLFDLVLAIYWRAKRLTKRIRRMLDLIHLMLEFQQKPPKDDYPSRSRTVPLDVD